MLLLKDAFATIELEENSNKILKDKSQKTNKSQRRNLNDQKDIGQKIVSAPKIWLARRFEFGFLMIENYLLFGDLVLEFCSKEKD